MPGRRRSASITMTRRPPSARAIARLATVVDLPSPAAALVTPTVCSWRSAYENCRFAARLRYASAAGERGSASIVSARPRTTGTSDWPLREAVANAVWGGPSGGVDGELITLWIILPAALHRRADVVGGATGVWGSDWADWPTAAVLLSGRIRCRGIIPSNGRPRYCRTSAGERIESS